MDEDDKFTLTSSTSNRIQLLCGSVKLLYRLTCLLLVPRSKLWSPADDCDGGLIDLPSDMATKQQRMTTFVNIVSLYRKYITRKKTWKMQYRF